MNANYDDEGCDGRLWRQLAEEERIDRAPLTPEEIEARIEGEIQDELRGLAALGLTPLQWVGVFAKRWDYDSIPPLYWHTGGMQRLEVLAELRGWVVANHNTDALSIAGAGVVFGGDVKLTIYDAIRWESAWAALRPLRLEEKGGATQERRRWFDALGLIDPPPGAFVGFCDLLGEWSAEIATASHSGGFDRPTSPTLKGWLARTDAALLTRELARVQPGHAEGRAALWRAWGRFIGDAWAIKEGLTWAGPISKGGE